jgi:FkbM family methyltransferase
MSIVAKIAGKVPLRWITSVALLQYRYRWMKPTFEIVANRVRNRDGEIQRGIGRGLRFNSGRSMAGYMLGTAEPDVQLALMSIVLEGMSVFDLGANVGFISMIAARLVGPGGYVISIEPLPANVRQIRHNAALNRFAHVTVCEAAIGREDGEACFDTTDFPTTGRLHNETRIHEEKTGELKVAVRQLDSVIADSGFPQPDIIKMDVEGAETDVLAGASRTLTSARPLMLIELHGTNESVAQALEEYGYDAHVLGSRTGILEAHWNSRIFAVPRERSDLSKTIETLTGPTPAV